MYAETRYAKSGDVNIAYQVIGDGALDLICVPGIISHLEHFMADPAIVRYYERLASFARVITFDKRGTGMSDREIGNQTLEDRMDDIRAVMDAAGSKQAAIFGFSEGGSLAAMFAATYPYRTRALILFGATAKYGEEFASTWAHYVDSAWGTGGLAAMVAPSLADDPVYRQWFARLERLAYSPSAAKAIGRLNQGLNVKHLLPIIRVPTLVIHRTNDRMVAIESGRYLGTNIPGAQFVELPGADHAPWLGDASTIADRIEEFLTGGVTTTDHDRVLSTVMFVDMVDSTPRAAAVGDLNWRDLLQKYHNAIGLEVARARGRVVKYMGDGMLATFDGPARSVRCGLAMQIAVAPIDVSIRVGLHTGEIEIMGDDIGGISVHIAARIASLAGAGEVLTSSTVKDLVSGSGLRFIDRGLQNLKGLDQPFRVLQAEPA